MHLDTVSRDISLQTYFFLTNDIVVRGHRINLLFISLFIILAIIQRFLLRRENNLKQQEKSKMTLEELQELNENDTRIGDESLDFVYRL